MTWVWSWSLRDARAIPAVNKMATALFRAGALVDGMVAVSYTHLDVYKRQVHITENGNAAYIFCSVDVLAQEKARAVEEALYERRVMEVLERGEADFAAGRVFHGVAAVSYTHLRMA